MPKRISNGIYTMNLAPLGYFLAGVMCGAIAVVWWAVSTS